MELDAQTLMGSLLIAIGAPTALITAFSAWRNAATKTEPVATGTRGADEMPSPAAVAWVADIAQAMGSAPPASVLASLTAGESRDQARARRIAELEAPEPQTMEAQA